MNESRQIRALFDAFLARFFENEISEGSRDLRASFARMIGMLAAPGFLLPFSNLYRWGGLASRGGEVLRVESIADKVVYISMAMAAMMLMAAVVWQALLVDRRDAIVLGSFPVRTRTIVIGKLAALFGYLAIVAAGMNVVAAVIYGTLLGGGVMGMLRAIPAHFIASVLACIFACTTVAAFQAALLAIAGPRVFTRLTAPAQMLLASVALGVLLFSPSFGGAAVDAIRGNARSMWVLWLPPMWFVGIYETLIGARSPIMPALALRALLAFAAVVGVLVAAYPLAYRRIAAAALRGSPLGTRRSAASGLLAAMMRRLPVRSDTRGATHYTFLTLGRVARNKLVVAAALGGAVALSLPFILRWAAQTWLLAVPSRSQIAVPFVFVMFGLAGARMAYNLPSEGAAAWVFNTAVRPARLGTAAARLTGLLAGAALPALIALPVYVWFWGPAVGISMALTLLTFGAFVSEIALRSVDFVPFTRAYNAERGQLQARWPLYLIGFVLFLQFLPWLTQVALMHRNYWIIPALLAASTVTLRYAHPPEPPPLIDADMENKPLALRLY